MGIFEESTILVQQVLGDIPVEPEPVKVFLSYSGADGYERNVLLTHLKQTGRNLLSVWSDSRLTVGEGWHGEISRELARAEIFVLLVSSHALSSSYIRSHEIRPALERHRRPDGRLKFFPALLKACNYSNDPDIGSYQVVHFEGSPIVSVGVDLHRAMAFLAAEICKEALRMRDMKMDDMW